MSGSYTPDAGAEPIDPWRTALLSQRDISLTVPVNFVTSPGVSLRDACFEDGVYDAKGATRCFSNLLAAGYKRFTLDVYWDVDRTTWNLCPVQIGNVTGAAQILSLPPVTSTPVIQLSTVRITERDAVLPTPWAAIRNFLGGRQAQGFSSSSTGSLSISASSASDSASSTVTSSASLASSSTAPSASSSTSSIPSYFINDTVIDVGSYRCSTNITLLFFMGTLAQYIGKTMNTLEASLIYLTLDIHAAVPADDPDGIAPRPSDSQLPVAGQFLSTVLGQNLSSYLYTPAELASDRTNLNNSWYKLPFQSQPDVSYYETVRESSSVYSTPDGWPGESYIEFQKSKRLLVEFGNVDVQMSDYNFGADSNTIFQNNFLRSDRNVSYSSNGTVTSGCFLANNTYIVSSSNNNSWAESAIGVSELQDSEQNFENGTFYSIGNLSACGVSPFLNQTLNNATADEDLAPYLTIPLSTIWSWAPGEPRNVTTDEEDASSLRCALMDMNLHGRWRVANCNEHHNWACRVGSTPYEWQISEDQGSYEGSATAGCGDNKTFSVPKTGLENSYLYEAMKRFDWSDDGGGRNVWVDVNSLDEDHCWVVGANSSCPYTNFGDDHKARAVIIPTIAAIIIFVLAVLTLFAKCATNRQSSERRRRRKGDDGWDYEGVPS